MWTHECERIAGMCLTGGAQECPRGVKRGRALSLRKYATTARECICVELAQGFATRSLAFETRGDEVVVGVAQATDQNLIE